MSLRSRSKNLEKLDSFLQVPSTVPPTHFTDGKRGQLREEWANNPA